jgi:hypothetical protein
VMIGYLGFKLPPAYIFPRISSERVSWLSRSKSKSEIGPEHERDGHEHRMDAIDFGKVERKGWDGKRGLTSNRPGISDSATKVLAVELYGSPGRPRRADRRDRSYDERRRDRKRDRGCQCDPGCVAKARSSGRETHVE